MTNVYKVKGQDRFVVFMSEYQNGILTTGGLYKPDELEKVTEPVIGITYNADCCTELPANWPDMLFLDDNNKRQHIREIDFSSTDYAFIMEDNTKSKEVTG